MDIDKPIRLDDYANKDFKVGVEYYSTKSFNFNNHLSLMEKTLDSFVPHNQELRFIPGSRLPVENVINIRNESLIKNKPYYPYHSAVLVKWLFYNELFHFQASSIGTDLLIGNPLKPELNTPIYEDAIPDDVPEDIVIDFLLDKSGVDYDPFYLPIHQILSIYNSISTILFRIIEENPNSIYELDIDSPLFILKRGFEIGTYRLKELS